MANLLRFFTLNSSCNSDTNQCHTSWAYLHQLMYNYAGYCVLSIWYFKTCDVVLEYALEYGLIFRFSFPIHKQQGTTKPNISCRKVRTCIAFMRRRCLPCISIKCTSSYQTFGLWYYLWSISWLTWAWLEDYEMGNLLSLNTTTRAFHYYARSQTTWVSPPPRTSTRMQEDYTITRDSRHISHFHILNATPS
jgi:hypothetical protein